MSETEILTLLPFLVVSGLALLIVVLDMISPRNDRLAATVGAVGVLVAIGVTLYCGPFAGIGRLPAEGGTFQGVYGRDQATAFLDLLFLGIAFLTICFAPDYLAPRKLPVAEFVATLLFAISGAMLLAGARDLLILFIGLELLVLPGYLMAGFAKRDGLSTEGAIKYFLLGSFSSAILLFGFAFIFGMTGTTSIAGIAERIGAIAGGYAPLPMGLGMGIALVLTEIGRAHV